MNNNSDKKRRDAVSFNAYYFAQQQAQNHTFSLAQAFQHIHDINLWGSDESASGEGSTEQETATIKTELQQLLQTYRINSITDAGCGDFGWMHTLNLNGIHYCGFDVLPETIQQLNATFANNNAISFQHGNFLDIHLPPADLIICRDVLVHLANEDILKALSQFKCSRSHYLLTTNFMLATQNEDIITGDWRVLNLTLPPFNLPAPLLTITEHCLQNHGLYADKSLCLWDLQAILDNPR